MTTTSASSPSSPTVAGWELALRLRRRREELGVGVPSLTAKLGFSRNYWSAVENERKILAEDKLGMLAELFELDETERAELFALREVAKQRGWWADYSGVFSEQVLRLYGLEYGACGIRTYESLLIPGLLQTPEYARALMSPEIPTIRQVEVDQRIAARRQRQLRVTGSDPVSLTAVVSEAALMQQTGGKRVLREQLTHLARMIETHPDVLELRIIPFTATGCGAFGASTFHLLDFASARLPTLAWQETVTAVGIIDDEAQVRDLSLTYAEAVARTLSTRESFDLVMERIRALS
ncbi:Scr1 family TA system antitoxin-like transcriptional regulator [Sciscionella sediminilitoris]|uniref:Scr1 family TA system antitoxin-like transcriptional regulator n=1 Tax=Sciscionella sediminilitoris TaxID=1445613 RepID=UPI0004DF1239|nr:Scr1 family TA system antitoxin-like transcriptional regulator [Sciscionella sp. SE31]